MTGNRKNFRFSASKVDIFTIFADRKDTAVKVNAKARLLRPLANVKTRALGKTLDLATYRPIGIGNQ